MPFAKSQKPDWKKEDDLISSSKKALSIKFVQGPPRQNEQMARASVRPLLLKTTLKCQRRARLKDFYILFK